MIDTLNEGQRAAVTAGDGPALVLAGAGSGKTRVIVERILWLIETKGVPPWSILALTFTNRAANEMKSRIAERLAVPKLDTWVGTFHAFGLHILRREMQTLGRPRRFTVFDDQDQLSLMRRLVKAAPTAGPRVSPREALSWISRLKQDCEEPGPSEDPDGEEVLYRALWAKYHAALKQASAVDFDDLLVLTARLLAEHPEALDRYSNRYRYVLVDEYQDTNRAQYEIARSLATEHGNLFVVGDEDQSIYSWRGANIENILGFERDFPGAEIFRLEQNYRSTAPILAAANAVVKNNVQRLGKSLWTEQKAGEPVTFYQAPDAEEEARYVVETILERKTPHEAVAVLFRTNAQARLLEEAFRKKALPYVVVGTIRFYARKEIKDLLCYLRLLVNPDDNESLRRILNVPPRGIGGATLQRIVSYAEAKKLSLMEALRELEDDATLGTRARGAVKAFVGMMDDLSFEAKQLALTSVLDRLVEKTRYLEYLRKSDEKDYRTRQEMVDEFRSACADFDKNGDARVEQFLQDLSLMSDIDEWDRESPAVTLMTCHSAKGLEFDDVFLVGLEDGLLPHEIALESQEGIEEERRLCYVAMTRARKRLTLSAAESRTVFGETRPRAISQFLGEIPQELLKLEGAAKLGGKRAMPKAVPADAARLKVGTRVRHARFGKGTVMHTSGSGERLKVRIRFVNGFSRQFMAASAPLELMEGKER